MARGSEEALAPAQIRVLLQEAHRPRVLGHCHPLLCCLSPGGEGALANRFRVFDAWGIFHDLIAESGRLESLQ